VGFTETISVLIFILILIGAVVFVIMSGYVVGPLSRLKLGERIMLIIGFIGILLVLIYAAMELLFHFLI